MRRILTRTLVAAAALAALPAAKQAEPEASVPQATTVAPIVERLRPSVVNISTITLARRPPGKRAPAPPPKTKGDPFDELFDRLMGARPGPSPDSPPEGIRGASLGSGFLVDADGFILTNNHVVQGATEIRVRLSDGRDFGAKVIGRDPLTDVALIRLQNPPKDLPPAVKLGDSDALRQGDFVLAMGSPFGLRDTVTLGIVSAKHRAGINADSYDDYIQTDAAINPGNSGGPLFNLRGEVVGINTLIVSPQIGQGIGFAIPISMARALLPQLREKGRVTRGFLGVTVNDLGPETAEHFKLASGTKGAFVQSVQPKSPADQAGLKPYDIITQVDGQPIDSQGGLSRAIALMPPGHSAKFTVLRGPEQKQLTVKLGGRPDEETAVTAPGDRTGAADEPADKEPPPAGLGVAITRITPELQTQLSIDGGEGVVITRVVPDGPADHANLRRGDVILEVNQQPIHDVPDVTAILARVKENEVVLLRVQRGAGSSILPVRVGGKSSVH
jgi:serine protease Do